MEYELFWSDYKNSLILIKSKSCRQENGGNYEDSWY